MKQIIEIKMNKNSEWEEFPLIQLQTAKRYKQRYGGRIAYITLMTKQGLFHKLYDKNDNLRAIIS